MFEKLTAGGATPSLNALRAFEAMARTGGASAAGAELCVTHSAVSRQVKSLEAALGVRLFEGPRHDLRLTAKGRALLAGLTPGFDAIDAAVRGLRGEHEVRLAVHPSLAVKWLIPRLSDFERRRPDVALLVSDLPIPAVRLRGADLTLRIMGRSALEPGMEVLADNQIGPVCAPGWSGERLDTAPRLVTRSHPQGWSDWRRLGGRDVARGAVRAFDHLHFAQDAAAAGLGVALSPRLLVQADIEAGRLVAPLGFMRDDGVLAVGRMRREATRAERAFVDWLAAQAAGDVGKGGD